MDLIRILKSLDARFSNLCIGGEITHFESEEVYERFLAEYDKVRRVMGVVYKRARRVLEDDIFVIELAERDIKRELSFKLPEYSQIPPRLLRQVL